MNNDNFLIEESDLELAKDICKTLDDSDIRNRAVANALAADIASKYFTEVEVDTSSGIHKIAQVLNDLDIADVYVKDTYIDVRLYFENSELCIPKSHFDRNILPVAYMFIKLDETLSNGLVTGFMLPTSVDKTTEHMGYYKVEEDELISFYDIESLLIPKYTDDAPENIETLIFDYLDGRLNNNNDLYNILINSKNSRILLQKTANVQTIFNYISVVAPAENIETSLDVATTGLTETEDLIETDDIEPLEGFSSSIDISDEGSFEQLEEFSSDVLEDSETSELDFPEIETTSLEEDANVDELEEFNLVESPIEENSNLEEYDLLETSAEESDEIDTFGDMEPNTNENEDLQSFNLVEPLDEENDITTEMVSINEEPLTMVDDTSEVESPITVDLAEETTLDLADESIIEEQEIPQEITTDNVENVSILEETPEQAVEPILEENFETVSEDETFNEFPTNTTPSMETIEQDVSMDDLESMLENDKSVFDETPNEESQPASSNENAPQIEELFGEENDTSEVLEDNFVLPVNKKSSSIIPLLGTLVLVAGLGYFGYTKFFNQELPNNEPPESVPALVQPEETPTTTTQDAMPVETVENISTPVATNEGNAISIPAIEQNLDASILVSNLSVNWEVPAGYLTNNTAKRYFTKMGKIIQLNLKTELLLLSKPPITNKIMLELEFNKNQNRFDVKGITASSGEKTVDDLITRTVKNALELNLKINMSNFANISGNPVLVIRL